MGSASGESREEAEENERVEEEKEELTFLSRTFHGATSVPTRTRRNAPSATTAMRPSCKGAERGERVQEERERERRRKGDAPPSRA